MKENKRKMKFSCKKKMQNNKGKKYLYYPAKSHVPKHCMVVVLVVALVLGVDSGSGNDVSPDSRVGY